MDRKYLRYFAAIMPPAILLPILIVIDWDKKDKLTSFIANVILYFVICTIYIIIRIMMR